MPLWRLQGLKGCTALNGPPPQHSALRQGAQHPRLCILPAQAKHSHSTLHVTALCCCSYKVVYEDSDWEEMDWQEVMAHSPQWVTGGSTRGAVQGA